MKMKYKYLMERINEGSMEVVSWIGTGYDDTRFAEVMKFAPARNFMTGKTKRLVIEVTEIPKTFKR